VAQILRDTLRSVDGVGRYGGEEFVGILPHTSSEEAHRTAERLRARVEAHPFKAFDREMHLTVSVGVATYPADAADSAADLIGHADKALYRAKQDGRNRVA
jgi:diguanylate cyclase (GGDEF)-like protein